MGDDAKQGMHEQFWEMCTDARRENTLGTRAQLYVFKFLTVSTVLIEKKLTFHLLVFRPGLEINLFVIKRWWYKSFFNFKFYGFKSREVDKEALSRDFFYFQIVLHILHTVRISWSICYVTPEVNIQTSSR